MKPPEASSGQVCGPVTAVTAPARKPAVIIRDMLVKNQTYTPPTTYLFSGKKTQTGGFGQKTNGYISRFPHINFWFLQASDLQ
jgi:hypothetical protein